MLSVLLISVVLVNTLTIQQYAGVGPIIQYAVFGTLLLISHIFSFIHHLRKNKF